MPFYFAYDNNYLYSFSIVGQKIEWMRANPLICVETEEIVSPQQWASVIIFGRYEELPASEADGARRNQPLRSISRSISETPERPSTRDFAYKLLRQNAMWWEPGSVKTGHHDTELPLVPSTIAFTSFRSPVAAAPPILWHRLIQACDDRLGRNLSEVGRTAALDTGDAERALVAVFSALQDAFGSSSGTTGTAGHVMSQLPIDLKRLWLAAAGEVLIKPRGAAMESREQSINTRLAGAD